VPKTVANSCKSDLHLDSLHPFWKEMSFSNSYLKSKVTKMFVNAFIMNKKDSRRNSYLIMLKHNLKCMTLNILDIFLEFIFLSEKYLGFMDF
jgi:hypothetical protein